MYRVRKTWNDPNSQIGAYTILDNAIRVCDENPGYSVFDEDGTVVHKSKIPIIRTMSYKAKLKKKINSSHPSGQKVTVTIDMNKNWVLDDGTLVPERSYLDLTKQIYDSNCRYSKADAESWVNNNGFSSSTPYLFWANKYGQRVYIFKGSKGNWVLHKVYTCGTGSIADGDGGDPGVGFKWKIYDKQRVFQGPRSIQHYNMHYSSPHGNSIHKGTTGKPSTHGCIALGPKGSVWAFENLPVNTRVILY